jgi:hypothetical protein
MRLQSDNEIYDSYIPSAAKESGFVMRCPSMLTVRAMQVAALITIGEMRGEQFRAFVQSALRQHFASRKMGEQGYDEAWSMMGRELVKCDVAAKWWAILELLHLNKKMVLFADSPEKEAKQKRKRNEAVV